MLTVMPLISSVVSFLFAVTVLDQFFARRQPYQLVWSAGLFLYFFGTGAEFLTQVAGLNDFAYRVWYLCGAMLVAAYLGMGTVYLLVPRGLAHLLMALLLAASVYGAVQVFTVSLDFSALSYPLVTLSGTAMPAGVRALTPGFNTFGTIFLVGGAAYSAWVFWRRRIMPHRMLSNVLIAVGAILPAFGGTFARFGVPEMLYATELLGIIIIFLGFLRSREVFGIPRVPFIHGFRRVL